MAKKFIWKVWLRLNHLTDDPNDYVAEVSTAGKTVRNEDIAQDIKNEGSELHYETILDILNRGDDRRIVRLQNGFTVLTKLIHIAPRVKGKWTSELVYKADEHHVTVDSSPSAELHAALNEIGVEALGIKDDGGARIGLVTDAKTGKTDGTVTQNNIITITGEKIKIEPDAAANVGVFFDQQGATASLKVAVISENLPKRVSCLTPALLAGKTYTLRIVTRYAGSNTLLKEPRTIVYSLPIKT
jgi:hypothetical protein